jgi:hypothetical protein
MQRRKVLFPEPDGPIIHHFLRFNIAADAAQHVAVAEALV